MSEGTWYKVTLTREQVAQGAYMQLTGEYGSILQALGRFPRPQWMEFFEEPTTGVVEFYFRPASLPRCGWLISKYGGEPVHEPRAGSRPFFAE